MRYIRDIQCLAFCPGFYVASWGFSLNETRYPNIHFSWRNASGTFRGPYLYIALSKKWKLIFDRQKRRQ